MTEKEFQKQIWRMCDQITTAEGVKGKVLGVAFSTRSVRAYISGSPEWVKCDLIETHTTGKGGDADDDAIIEELHNKVLKQADEINRLQEERRLLQEKISRNYLGELLRAVNVMQQGLQERKSKIKKVEDSLAVIAGVIDKLNHGYDSER